MNAMDSAQTLARWQADEAAVLQGLSPHTGVARAEQLQGLSGIEFLRAMLAGQLPRVPISQTLGFLLIDVEPGRAVFQGRPAANHYNPMGSVHGGWYATLLDSALGCCVQAALPAGKAYTTLELKVNMVRALSDKVPLVRAEGKLIHLGGQTATAEARLFGPDGKLYGHGSTTCLVFATQATTPPAP
jgi:uncharacterized protein (TIGR00369 family)